MLPLLLYSGTNNHSIMLPQEKEAGWNTTVCILLAHTFCTYVDLAALLPLLSAERRITVPQPPFCVCVFYTEQ